MKKCTELEPRLLKVRRKGLLFSRMKPTSTSSRNATLCGALVLLAGSSATFGQAFSITNIVVPAASSLAVSSMNADGHVAGYFYTTNSEQHAFLWQDGAGMDLGTLGGSTSVGNCVNNFGQVAGYSSSVGDTEFHAFSGIGQTLFDLGTLGGPVSTANWISDAGHVTGYSFVSALSVDTRAFLIRNSGGLQDLGTLGGSYSSGAVVNNVGQVAGDSTTPGDSENHAFLHNGTLRDLGTLGGVYSSAHALNDAGHVAGESSLSGEAETHAFLFDGTTMHDVGTLGGTYSAGYHINDASQVVGDSSLAGDTEFHGFIYHNGTLTDLGTLGGGHSSAWGVNNFGQVVGTSSNAQGKVHAFVWQNGTMHDLNSLIPANTGWELTGAHFINDSGQIAGAGLLHGQPAWFLLTPQAPNQSPVAQAGSDQNVSTAGSAALVGLNGSASSDPDGDALTYVWAEGAVTLGTTATLSVSLGVGSHTITLRVTDTHDASAEDTVVVVVTSTADTVAPVVNCPENRTASANELGQASVPDFLTGLVASDNVTEASALVKTQSPPAGTLVRSGSHQVLLTVTDAAGNATTCNVAFNVSDTTPPTVLFPEEFFRKARVGCLAVVPNLSRLVRARDNCTPNSHLQFVQQPAAGTPVTIGNHVIHLSLTDAAGNVTRGDVLFHVVDVAAPRFRSLTADPVVLEPADRRMVPVTLTAVVTDNCTENPRCQIVSVTSSEFIAAQGENPTPDWNFTGDMTLKLRAEVLGRGARIYTIRVSCTDASGNTTYRNVHVRVSR
jgi:probable HAF family extracellular repeat protein